MKAVWLKGHKDREARRLEIEGYRNAFGELTKVLLQEETKNPVRDYSPGWAEKQIAVNEWNAAIQYVINLIDINKEEP